MSLLARKPAPQNSQMVAPLVPERLRRVKGVAKEIVLVDIRDDRDVGNNNVMQESIEMCHYSS